jgi:hypothetical protein
MQHQYVQGPYKVRAEQYFAASDPPPAHVHFCTVVPQFPNGEPHVHTATGVFAPIDGDWIVEEIWSPHAVLVIPDAEFTDRFGGAVI